MDAAKKGSDHSPIDGPSDRFFDARDYDSSSSEGERSPSNPRSRIPVKFVVGEESGFDEDSDVGAGSTVSSKPDITDLAELLEKVSCLPDTSKPPRDVAECLDIYKKESVASSLTDEEIIALVQHKHIPSYQLEKAVGNMERGVSIRYLI